MAQVVTFSRSSISLLVGCVVSVGLLLLYKSLPQVRLDNAAERGGAIVAGRPPFDYQEWTTFTAAPLHSGQWYNVSCFGGSLQAALASLPGNAAAWRQSREPACRRLAQRFAALYTVDVRQVEVSLPAPFRQKVLGWLGGSELLVGEVEHQVILQVINNYDLHNMAYNPVRARRPQPHAAGPGPREQLAKQTADSRTNCDFCSYDTMTAYEAVFGRPSSQHAVVVGNTFKLDGSHALVVSREHSPLELSLAQRDDMLALAERWCGTVHARRPDLQYPSIVWDSGLHAGISQVHPHIHVMLSPGHYTGGVETLRRAAALYTAQFAGENYFATLVEVHEALGLTVRLGSATAMAMVNPLLDMEVWVVDSTATPAWRRLYSLAVRSLEQRLGQYCHSTGVALPALADRRGQMPALARLLSRGDCTAVRADVSSLELFTLSSISTDPYRVISQLALTVAEHGQEVT